ncbi:sensor domain-containing diguanylate cyclase [Bacillus sp. HMF5848]|uniref:sensor domain-containing diguanylate cyclase n=1 Tax=Bacillus sp. HMF5848 TaxID=2495421 RepID=UPI000F7A75CD|nr:sensor domain-containing diguanylate cyclase [Bacillus sp. HMF5848]RSK28189.1 sensor domain-containing diguanylate cyclase [Bacillus sp. HMF5848]
MKTRELLLLQLKANLLESILLCNENQISFQTMLNKIIAIIAQECKAEVVAFYTYDNWGQGFINYNGTTKKDDIALEGNELTMCRGLVNDKKDSTIIHGPSHVSCYIPIRYDKLVASVVKINYPQLPPYFDETFVYELTSLLAYLSSKKYVTISKVTSDEKRYEHLYRVTSKFHSSMNIDDVLLEVIRALKEIYPTFSYQLLLSHDNSKNADLPITYLDYDGEYTNQATMQAFVTGDVQIEDLLHEKKSILYAPLKGKQGVYGVLQVIASNAIMFPKQEVGFITLLANTAGSALENAQLYEQSRRLITDLQLINEASHKLNSNLRLTETMTYLCEQMKTSIWANEVGFILLADNDEVKVIPESTSFFHGEAALTTIQFVIDKVKTDKEALFVGDIMHYNIEQDQPYRSLMAVPMVQGDAFKGVTIVLHEKPYYFSFETFKLMQSLIHHSTLAFANSILREELELLVITDHLTQLYSRKHLDDSIGRSMKNDPNGTFLLIDIDDFKKINDTYGHQTGDKIIIQVANIIKDNIRDTDFGARWGGEELAIYLPKVDLEIGTQIAERLVEKVRELTEPTVTVSCGVSYWHAERQDSVKRLFNRADEALYIAKRNGKNQVHILEPNITV